MIQFLHLKPQVVQIKHFIYNFFEMLVKPNDWFFMITNFIHEKIHYSHPIRYYQYYNKNYKKNSLMLHKKLDFFPDIFMTSKTKKPNQF